MNISSYVLISAAIVFIAGFINMIIYYFNIRRFWGIGIFDFDSWKPYLIVAAILVFFSMGIKVVFEI